MPATPLHTGLTLLILADLFGLIFTAKGGGGSAFSEIAGFGRLGKGRDRASFIDEIDALGRKREGEGVSGGEREQTLNQLLVEMDGFDTSSGVVIMGATNRPDLLDAALLRPGRFDRHITLEPPDAAGRADILAVHTKGRPLGPDADLGLVAARTPGFTDLASVINEAALLALRSGDASGRIGAAQLSEAIQRVLHGPHRGTLLSPAERRRLAVHEAGHATVAAAAGRAADVQRVSIVARGRGLGATGVTGEAALATAGDLEARLRIAMGGIAAEVLALGESSTTAADDLQKATATAREMVGIYGMSAALGRLRLMSSPGGYLGENTAVIDDVSDATLAGFDAEVARLLAAAEAQATATLEANAELLELQEPGAASRPVAGRMNEAGVLWGYSVSYGQAIEEASSAAPTFSKALSRTCS